MHVQRISGVFFLSFVLLFFSPARIFFCFFVLLSSSWLLPFSCVSLSLDLAMARILFTNFIRSLRLFMMHMESVPHFARILFFFSSSFWCCCFFLMVFKWPDRTFLLNNIFAFSPTIFWLCYCNSFRCRQFSSRNLSNDCTFFFSVSDENKKQAQQQRKQQQ